MRNNVLLTFALLISELYVASAQGGCEADWSRSPDRCLSLFGDAIDGAARLTWFQADEACKAMGASLASIKNKETQPIITAMLVQAPSSNVWIGLNDVAVEGAFKWPDGTSLDETATGFTNWGQDQPDNANNAFEEDCVYLRAFEEFPGEWYDGFCYYPRAYICEKPQDPTLPTVSTSVACGVVDPNYIKFESSCYKLDSTERAFSSAQTFCIDDQSDKSSTITWVQDAFEEAFLQAILLNAGVATAWIGLKTQQNNNNLRWLDGIALTYTDWEENRPQSTQRCVVLTTNGWQDVECDENHAVICRKNLGKRRSPPIPLPGSRCPGGMQEIDTYCAVGLTSTSTWQEAQDRCRVFEESSSTLAASHMLSEDNSLASTSYQGGSGPVEFWIGLRKTNRGEFVWADGTVLDYVNFKTNIPNEGCVFMTVTPKTGEVDVEWQTDDCNSNRGYTCRAPKMYVHPVNGGCLPGWYQLDNNCFHSVGLQDADRLEYSDADEYCRQEGGGRGKLFEVTNQLEQSLLALLLQDFVGLTNLWIGLSDRDAEGQFVWSSGTPITFSQWAPNQPNGFTDIPNEPFRDCVEVRTDPKDLGEWDDINCLERRGFICQTPLYNDLNSTDIVVPEICEGRQGYSKYLDGCYKLINVSLSFDAAQEYCRKEDASLSTVRDGFYNSLLSLLVNWQTPTPEYVWIGLRQNNEDVYGWERAGPSENPWPLTYAKWEKGNPKGFLNICGTLNRNSSWVDMDCNTPNMFICESINTEVPVTPPTHCADGWSNIEGRCYKFKTLTQEYPQIHFTFSEAQSACTERYNATLPGIHSFTANNLFTVQAVKYLGNRNVWLGLYQSVEGYYVYQDRRIVDYVNWASEGDLNDCTSLNTTSGKWHHERCFQIGGLVCETEPLPGPEIPCEDGWSYGLNDCYFVSDAADDTSWMSWKNAEQWCNEHKAHLTTLEVGVEREYVHKLITSETDSFWIGLNNIAQKGEWIWADGTTYDNADKDQWSPNDETNENNMEYCALINEDAQWEDHNCGIRRPYICKWDVSQANPVFPSQAPPVGECFKGAYKLDDRCYDLSSMGEPKTWIDAHKECQYRSGELAAIHNQGVQALLSFSLSSIKNNVWIGLNRVGKFDQYYWADGSALDFTNWALGEPNRPFPQQGNENEINSCVQMANNPIYAGRWSDVDCQTKMGFICEMPLDPKGIEQPFPYEPCPNKPNYHAYGESCFRILMYNTTFSNAKTDCEEEGAYLASVGDAYEQAFVELFMSYFQVNEVWIGLQRGEMDQFEWVDGWPIEFTSWASGFPTGSSNINRCVLLTHQGWKNVNCFDAHYMVCKTTTAPKPPPPEPPSGLCRQGWFEFQNRCYFFDVQNRAVSYAEALVLCQNQGSSVLMASSTNSQVNTFLQTTARSVLGVNSVWLGLIFQKEEFQWIDGSLYTYTNWASDQPNTPIGGDICVQMTTEGAGVWKNGDCFVKAGYVCGMPLVEATPYVSTTMAKFPSQKPLPQNLSTEAIIGISVGCGGVLLIILMAACCYFTEKSHMNQKMYAKQRKEMDKRGI